jgi:multidrug efflux system membrane fusion protein
LHHIRYADCTFGTSFVRSGLFQEEIELKWRWIVTGLFALGLLGGICAIAFLETASGKAAPSTSADGMAVPVTAAMSSLRDVPVIIEELGTVQPIETVSVQARVNGQITKTLFTPGSEVKQGALLFEIDPRPFQAALEQAQGQLDHDQALLTQAQSDLARFQQLEKEDSIAVQQVADQAFLVQQDQGTVRLDEGNVANAQLNLAYCEITAPTAGLTGPLLVDPGNYVQAGANTNLMTLTEMKPIYVNFSIPQASLDEVHTYQAKAPLEVEAYSPAGKLIATGKLSVIDNQVSTTTGTVMLQATFPNENEQLWPGAYVSVRLVVYMRHNAVTVPDQTVMAGPNSPYVYVIEPDNTVKRVDVSVAARQDGIAVISKGVTSGERVVTDGQYRLVDNAKATIKPSGPASTS